MAVSPFSALLPLYGIAVTLRFTAKAEFSYFHQMTVDAFVRYLLDSPKDYAKSLTTEAPESGRLDYTLDDTYRFTVTTFAGNHQQFKPLLQMLSELPKSAPVRDSAAPLRDNIKLETLVDLTDGKPLVNISGLTPFTIRHLIDISHTWQNEKTNYPRSLHFQWLSPVRLLRSHHDRNGLNLTGEHRFCRDKTHLTPALLIRRIIESLNNLITELGQNPTTIESMVYDSLPLAIHSADLFWLDTPYYSKDGEDNTAGGLVGYITLTQTAPLPHGIWQGLILAQYLGVGQRRVSGFGKYQLTLDPDPHSHGLPLRLGRSQSLLDHALSKRTIDKAILLAEEKKDNHQLSEKQQAQLHSAFGQLRRQDYHPPPLFGQLIPKKDGSMRALAIAPVYDRILQKAVSLTISPCIDAILYQRTYAYRKGHSRQQARFDIQQAWDDGYRWVYESDVDDFFDSIDREQLIKRLISLFGNDPMMSAIAHWLSAPVVLNGQRIERPKGIPQGSPLSPVLANFILDDFDADLESRGFRLVRFADDFIILCKSRVEAELAADQVKASLTELGLSINVEKSHIVSLEQGFKFLGYMFQNEWAVDISGTTSDGTKTFTKDDAPEYMPAWLAALGDQQPKSIEQTRYEAAGNIGDMDDEGTFLTVTGESSMLSLDNKQVIIKRDEVTTHSIPLAHLSGILLFGNHHLTTPLIKAALKAQIPIHLADRMGNYEGAIWKRHPIDNSYKGWFIQLQHFDTPDYALTLAKATVKSRLNNMHKLLQRYHKRPVVMSVLKQIARFEQKINSCQELSRLLGVEGVATREYFKGLGALVPEWCEFQGRNRRPPKDPFNVLLSFGYTWLYAHADAILTTLGFLTWKGYYHQTSSGHAALASDIIESYRHLVERTALTALNANMIKLDDFRYEDNQIRLGSEARKKYLTLLEKRFLKETDGKDIWQCLHQQGESLWGNINHHSPYLPLMESKVG